MPDQYHAPSVVRERIRSVLDLEERIETERPNRAAQGLPLVLRAFEIVCNGYRQCRFSPGQLRALEDLVTDLDALL